MNNKKFTKEYEVHYYEADHKKRALETSIINYFTDTNLNLANICEVPLEKLHQSNLTLMLQKYDVEFLKPVYQGEKLRVTASVEGVKGPCFYRNGMAEDSLGNTVVKGRGLVYLVNTESRRPTEVPKEIYEAYGIERPSEEDFPFQHIKAIEREDYSKEFEVRYSDIDINGHVNNSKYITWALETLPFKHYDRYRMERIRIVYLKETFYGEKIYSKIQIDNSESAEGRVKALHEIRNREGKLLCATEMRFTTI